MGCIILLLLPLPTAHNMPVEGTIQYDFESIDLLPSGIQAASMTESKRQHRTVKNKLTK
jgi:hypothetical protein